MKELSWEPIASGRTYCAPACGAKCTKAEYSLAVKRAATLAESLGPGWEPFVWENLGWHFRVVDSTGCLKIHEYRYGEELSYTAYLGPGAGGIWVENAATPQRAISKVRKAIKDYLKGMSAPLTAVGLKVSVIKTENQ